MVLTKKDGKPRGSVDLRPLNERIVSDSWPMPRMDCLLGRARVGRYYTGLDLFLGYWSILIAEWVSQVITFRCHKGSLRFKVNPYGPKSAPACFQRFMTSIFGDFSYVLNYADNIFVLS